jgi:hypothetical protein
VIFDEIADREADLEGLAAGEADWRESEDFFRSETALAVVRLMREARGRRDFRGAAGRPVEASASDKRRPGTSRIVGEPEAVSGVDDVMREDGRNDSVVLAATFMWRCGATTAATSAT